MSAPETDTDSRRRSPESLRRSLRFFDAYALAVGSVIGTGIFFLPGKAAARMGPRPSSRCSSVPSWLRWSCSVTRRRRVDFGGPVVRCGMPRSARESGRVRSGVGDVGRAGMVLGCTLKDVRRLARAILAACPRFRIRTHCWPDVRLDLAQLARRRLGGRINTISHRLETRPVGRVRRCRLVSVDSARFSPFAPQGFGDLGGTTMVMLYAYVGFEGAVIPAAEVRDPQRNLPRALLLGMVTIFVVYVGVWTVCTGTLAGLAHSESPVGTLPSRFSARPAP